MDALVKQFITRLKKKPNDPNLACEAAQVYASRGLYNDAISTLKRGLDYNPDDAWLQFRLAEIYLQYKQFGQSAQMIYRLKSKGVVTSALLDLEGQLAEQLGYNQAHG